MNAFTDLFVGQPITLLIIAACFFAGYLLAHSNTNLRAKALLTPAVLWLLWAVWEWGILRFTPEANIRVDLLLILPIVLIASVVGTVMLLRTGKSSD